MKNEEFFIFFNFIASVHLIYIDFQMSSDLDEINEYIMVILYMHIAQYTYTCTDSKHTHCILTLKIYDKT